MLILDQRKLILDLGGRTRLTMTVLFIGLRLVCVPTFPSKAGGWRFAGCFAMTSSCNLRCSLQANVNLNVP